MTRVRRIDSGLILMECGGWNAADTDEADEKRIRFNEKWKIRILE
jgi:hypothetical protein